MAVVHVIHHIVEGIFTFLYNFTILQFVVEKLLSFVKLESLFGRPINKHLILVRFGDPACLHLEEFLGCMVW